MAEKLDLSRVYKAEYVTPQMPVIVDVGPAKYLTLEGQGRPEGNARFEAAIGALYGMVYTIKMTRKAAGSDFKVMMLEGLWWSATGDRLMVDQALESWRWKLLIRVPDFITAKDVRAAANELRAKGKSPEFEEIKLETLKEKHCVQLLHVGPYSNVGPDIQRMAEFARKYGMEQGGPHHEIYLSDPRRVAPERLRTILRHPLRAASAPPKLQSAAV